MGVVLVVGFLVVGAAAWMKVKAASKSVASSCPGGELDLKGKGHVVDTTYDGNILRIAMARQDGDIEMVHVDVCTGRQIGSLKIHTDGQ